MTTRNRRWRNLSRRTLLGLFGAVPALAVLPSLAHQPPSTIAHPGDRAAALAALLAHRDSAARIGERYLRQYPHERDPEWLAGELLAGAPGDGTRTFTAAGDGIARHFLAERRRRDFMTGATVQIEGWVLSRSEARLCALAALVPAPVA